MWVWVQVRARAAEMGLINRVVAPEILTTETMELARNEAILREGVDPDVYARVATEARRRETAAVLPGVRGPRAIASSKNRPSSHP